MAQNKLKITYKGEDLVNTDISTAKTKTLKTAGKYMEADVVINAEGGSGSSSYITFPLTHTGLDSFSADYTGYKKTNMCPNQTTYYTGFSLGTVSGWGFNIDVYFTPYSANAGAFLASNEATGPALRLQVNSGKMYITGYFDRTVSNVGNVLIGQENHIRLYCTGTGYKPPATIELNGTVIATGTRASTIASPTLHIGGNIQGGFDGEIRYVKIYDIRNDRLCFEAYGVKDTINDKQYVYMRSEDDPSYNGLHEPPSVWTSNKTYEDIAGFNPVSISIPHDSIYKLGLLAPEIYEITTAGKLQHKANLDNLNFDGVVSVGNYACYNAFSNQASSPYPTRHTDLYFNDLESVAEGSFTEAFKYLNYSGVSEQIGVYMPKLKQVGINSFDNMFSYAKVYYFECGDSEVPWTITTSYPFYYMFYASYDKLKNGFKIKGLTSITGSSAFSYFNGSASASASNSYNENAILEFTDLTTINASSAFAYAFRYRGCETGRKWNVFPKLTSVDGSSAFNYAFSGLRVNVSSTYPQKQHIFTFPKLETIGTTTGNAIFAYAFNNVVGQWKYMWFPKLKTIGYSATTAYSWFNYAFQGTTADNYFELCMPELTSIISTSTSSTATYSCFNYCTCLKKAWLPKLSSITGKPNYDNMFRNCTQAGFEIHFGIENETYIKSLSGYATKFGATNSTIYFDCVNHITVNGVVYNRDGEHYITECPIKETSTSSITHPNDRYSWKDSNGNIVYTLECWTPAVSDSVFDENDNVVGSISAIA